jgi:hypothetical protein
MDTNQANKRLRAFTSADEKILKTLDTIKLKKEKVLQEKEIEE